MSDKPTPLKVFGRSHYACTRCKLSKIKCLGEKPACANCKAVHKEQHCAYPSRDRKIVIMELDLAKLQARVEYLESLVATQTPHYAALRSAPDTHILVERRQHLLLASHLPDSYLLPGSDCKYPPFPLLLLCAHNLPEEDYARTLVDTVTKTYQAEFYLFDQHEFHHTFARVYLFFATDLLLQLALDTHTLIPSSVLCHFFAVVAFGEQLRNSTVLQVPESIAELTGTPKQVPGLALYNVALRLFNLANEEIDLRFIQCSLLLGFYATNLNCHNTVQTFFGIALRSAVTNGFHRKFLADPSETLTHETILRREKSKRVWWSAFVTDNMWAAKMNMPVHIHYTDTDVALPKESSVDLYDNFNTDLLEANVHLVKFLARFNKLIYGPNIRTLSINYINTEQFNQKLLVKNILNALKTIVHDFEQPVLLKYENEDVIRPVGRIVGNLILRYNLLVMLVITPLISISFDRSDTIELENRNDALRAFDKALEAATGTICILKKFYEHNKLFVLGFWDSQNLFSAILILVMASFAVDCSDHLHTAIALLHFMAKNGNINALNCYVRLERVKDFMDAIPEAKFNLDLTLDINNFLRKPALHGPDDLVEAFYPLKQTKTPSLALRFPPGLTNLFFECLGLTSLLPMSQTTVSVMARTLVGWDSYKGMPIQVSGTGRVAPPLGGSQPPLGELKIGDLI